MVLAVIPARLASSRFPGKVLYSINGRPLLYHVWSAVRKARQIDKVIVASSDREILTVAKDFGAEIFRTAAVHKTGSDRSAEVARSLSAASIVVNVQADTLDLPASALNRVISFLKKQKSSLAATLIYPMPAKLAKNSDRVKVVVADDHRALWFSRAPIPWPQQPGFDSLTPVYWGHVGVYAYRNAALQKFAAARQTRCEKVESLEQLRFLESVGAMHAIRIVRAPRSIDRPEDILAS